MSAAPQRSAHAASPLTTVWTHGGAGLIAAAAFLFSCSSLCVKLITLHSHLPMFEVMLIPSLLCLLGTSTLLHLQGEAIYPGAIATQYKKKGIRP